MATFLDVTGLAHFSSIFVFLFVWLVVFAVLSFVRILGENKFINAIIGLLLAIFVLISPLATLVVAKTAPFLAVVFLFIVLLLAVARMLGGEVEAFPALKSVLVVIIILIVLIGAGMTIRDQLDQQGNQKDISKSINLIFHPVMLGLILLFSIAVFTIALLAGRSA